MEKQSLTKVLNEIELKEINGGITPFGAVLTVFGVISVVEGVAYGVGYAHGWIDKQIEKISDE